MKKLHETDTYITIKDQKEDFPNNISCRLINPSKSNIGKISKFFLDKINQQIQLITKVNQWKDTSSVTEWFNNFENKERLSFTVFDIESFYPTISENLFVKAVQFSKQITKITDEDINSIMKARKTLLFNGGIPRVKKEGNEDFDVPMGCFDGAEVCELVGSFILKQISQLFEHHSVGLYRDDSQAILKGLSSSETERVKKNFIKPFQDCALKTTIKASLHIVNFLDITSDLRNNNYKPLRKSGNHPVYINKNSNDPKTILRELPKSISKRLSDLSSNKEIFQNVTPMYFEALKKNRSNEFRKNNK